MFYLLKLLPIYFRFQNLLLAHLQINRKNFKRAKIHLILYGEWGGVRFEY